MRRLGRSVLALAAIGAASCARHRAKPPPEVPGTGDLVVGGVSGAPGSSLAVVFPYTNSRCRDGRVFIAGGGGRAVTMMDLPCFERGDCSPTEKRTAPGPADRVIRLQDHSLLSIRVAHLVKPAITVERSTDCGDTWTPSTVGGDALGEGAAGDDWDHLADAYADPWDPHGLVYLAIDAASGNDRRTVLVWSNDFGSPSSWHGQAVLTRDGPGDARVAMAATAGGRLYLLDVVGTSPRLTSITVDPAAGTLSMLPSWYVSQAHEARAALPADGASWEDRASPGSGSLALAANGRVAGFDRLVAVYQSGRVARVMGLGIHGPPLTPEVETIALVTASSRSDAGRVARATLVEGAPESGTTALTWDDEDPATGSARTQWMGFVSDPRNLASRPEIGPMPASTDAGGAPRGWGGAGARGPTARGAAYRGAGGFAGFLLPWIEGGAAPGLHIRAARVTPMRPWENHVFDRQDDRWYTDGADWAPGWLKGDCSSSSVMVGLSANEDGRSGHSMLCHNNLIPMLAPSSVAVEVSNGWTTRDSLPDWDRHNNKGECAEDEAVTGIAQTGKGQVTSVRCTRMGGGFHRNKCEARVLDGDFNRGSMALDDWAPKALKGQCIAGQVVKGVSTTVPAQALHAILCCYVSVM